MGIGEEGKYTASISFAEPVQSVGMAVLFATGSIKVRFLDADGETLNEVEQNGQADPEASGAWADYFAGFKNSGNFAKIRKVEFMRSNISDSPAPKFAIDDLSFVSGRRQPSLIMPDFKEDNLSQLLDGQRSDVCPMAASGKPSVARNGDMIILKNKIDGTSFSYQFDSRKGLESLKGQLNGGSSVPLGKDWGIRLGKTPSQSSPELKGVELNPSTGAASLNYLFSSGSDTLPVSVKVSLSGGSLRVELNSAQAAALEIARPSVDNEIKLADSGDESLNEITFFGFGGGHRVSAQGAGVPLLYA